MAKPARSGPRHPCWRPSTAPGRRRPLPKPQRIEAKRRAELEAPAKAQKAKIEVDAEAEAANKRRIEAEGEAAAIFAKLGSRSPRPVRDSGQEGRRPATHHRGMRRLATEAFQMLMLEHFDDLVEASARAISNIKFDKVVVWDRRRRKKRHQQRHGQLANTTWPDTLPPDDASDERHRRCGNTETLANFSGINKTPEVEKDDKDKKATAKPVVET